MNYGHQKEDKFPVKDSVILPDTAQSKTFKGKLQDSSAIQTENTNTDSTNLKKYKEKNKDESDNSSDSQQQAANNDISLPENTTDSVYYFGDSIKQDSLRPHSIRFDKFYLTTSEQPENHKTLKFKEKNKITPDWIIGILFFSFVLLAFIRFFYRKYIDQVVNGTFNYNIINKLFREKNSNSQRASLVMNFIFIMNFGLFIYLVFSYYTIHVLHLKGFKAFLIIMLIISFIYILKYINIKIIGYIFLAQKEFNEYLHSIFLYNKNMGLFLFPVIIGIPYITDFLIPLLIYTGLGLVFSGFILRIVRGGVICFRLNILNFYTFLYLCALEILPLFFLYKIFILLT